MRLLIIDDNVALAWRLQKYLSGWFEVQIARTGYEGERLAAKGQYDALILDLSLPDIDGEQICIKLRQHNIHTPILILSGTADVESKVRLLENGADDYVTKPFISTELLARTKALIRRHPIVAASSPLKIDDLIIDPSRRVIERSGQRILLRRKEFDILEYLVRNQGTIVTKAMILEHVWDDLDKNIWNNTVRVHIKHLRDKIDRPFGSQLIKTIRGIGYTIENP